MKNQVKGGDPHSVMWTNGTGSAVSAGDFVVLGGVDAKKVGGGVAMVDIANTASGAVAISGCFRLPKVATAVIAQGDSVNWDSSESAIEDNAHTTAAGDVAQFGMADAAAGNGATTVDVWLGEPGTYDAA